MVLVVDAAGTDDLADAWVRVVRLPAGATTGEVVIQAHQRRSSSDAAAAADVGPVKDPTWQSKNGPECATNQTMEHLVRCGVVLGALYEVGAEVGETVYLLCTTNADDCTTVATLVAGAIETGCAFVRPDGPGPAGFTSCWYGNVEMYFDNPVECLTGPRCTFTGHGYPGYHRGCPLCAPLEKGNYFSIQYHYAQSENVGLHFESYGSSTSAGMALTGNGSTFDTFQKTVNHSTYECATDVDVWWDIWWDDGAGTSSFVNPRGGGTYTTDGHWTYTHEPDRACLGLPGVPVA
jgi:hypothetical protein